MSLPREVVADVRGDAQTYRRLWAALRYFGLPSFFLLVCVAGIVGYQALGANVYSDVDFSTLLLPDGDLRKGLHVAALFAGACAFWLIGGFGIARAAAGATLGAASGLLFAAGCVMQGWPDPNRIDSVDISWKVFEAIGLALVPVIVWCAWRILFGGGHQESAPAIVASAFSREVANRRQTYRAFHWKRLWLPVAAVFASALLLIAGNFTTNVLIEQLLGFSVGMASTQEGMAKFIEAHPGRIELVALVYFAAMALVAGAIFYLWRTAWRRVRRTAGEVIADAHYRPVVFLRSFLDEDRRVKARNLLRRVLFRGPRLEEVLVNHMARLGPAVAIGLPGERVPRLGALRAYYADDQWQAAVQGWIDRSYLVVMLGGASRWVLWELWYILHYGYAGRLLLVLPPDKDEAGRIGRWTALCSAAVGTPWHQAMLGCDPRRKIGVVFRPDGGLSSFEGSPRDQVDIEVMVHHAIVATIGQPRRI